LTNERVEDFRATLTEIVDIKNGNMPKDFYPDQLPSEAAEQTPLRMSRMSQMSKLSKIGYKQEPSWATDFNSPVEETQSNIKYINPNDAIGS